MVLAPGLETRPQPAKRNSGQSGETSRQSRVIASLLGWSSAVRTRDPWGPMPPTGRVTAVPGFIILRVAQGHIVERWGVIDDLGALWQLGLAPPMPGELVAEPGIR
jgi:SnoaL-like polyketide cyclase